MADLVPLRLLILKKLTDAMAEVTFVDDLARPVSLATEPAVPKAPGVKARPEQPHVFRGRVQFGEGDELPVLSILEVPLQPEGVFAGRDGQSSKVGWELVFQGFIADNPVHPTDPAHYFLAAVKKRLIALRRDANKDKGILELDGFVDALTFNSGVVRPPDETSAVAHFWMTVYLELVEDLSDPYIEA